MLVRFEKDAVTGKFVMPKEKIGDGARRSEGKLSRCNPMFVDKNPLEVVLKGWQAHQADLDVSK